MEPKLYLIQFENGEEGLVAPLSVFVRKALNDKANELYPPPDPKDYLKPIENALPGLNLLPPEETSIELTEAKARAAIERRSWIYEQIVNAGVLVDTPEGRDITLERFAPRLSVLEQIITLPDDRWLACVKFCLISTGVDILRIVSAASESLGEEEIRQGLAVFQRPLQRNAAAGNHRKQSAPRVTAKTERASN